MYALHLHHVAEAHEGHGKDAGGEQAERGAEAVRDQLLAFRYLCSS